MSRIFYDLHIHSALSACADDDMTPNNIVNMAKIKELDVIAITDHNSAANCRAAVEAGKRAGLHVIPGIEVTTAEEIHLLCYFCDVNSAEEFSDFLGKHRPNILNKPHVFGRQLLFDASDNIIGEVPELLFSACSLSMSKIISAIAKLGGKCCPAHVDKNSYSIYSILGYFPPEYGFVAAEVFSRENVPPELRGLTLLYNSDAHALGDISERNFAIDASSPRDILNAIFKTF